MTDTAPSSSPDRPPDTGPSPDGKRHGPPDRPWTKKRTRSDLGRMSPEERSLRARLASHASWAQTADPAARTAPARAAFLDRFERQVDPDGTLDPAERARRADHARKAHFAALALKSAKVRRAKKARAGKEGRR